MHNLLLQEAIKDYYYFEPQVNIDALEEYCACIEHGKDCGPLEEHIFERLDIYLEQVFPIFESFMELSFPKGGADDYDEDPDRKQAKDPKKTKKGPRKVSEEERKINSKTREFENKTKGRFNVLGKLRGAIGVTSLRQGIKDAVHTVKNKTKKGISKGVISGRKKFRKTDVGKKLRDSLKVGIKSSLDKIRKEKENVKRIKNEWVKIKDSGSERYKKLEREHNRATHRLSKMKGSVPLGARMKVVRRFT